MLIPFDGVQLRRYSIPEIKEKIRHTYGLVIVDGFAEAVTEESNARSQHWPIASYLHTHQAWCIDHSTYSHFTWLTQEVPDDCAPCDVVFVFPLAMGYGVGYPEPSGWFELCINGKTIIRFREVKYSELWTQGDCALYYDVRRVHVAPDGLGLYLDPWSKGSRMVSMGIGILKVPNRYVAPGQKAKLTVKAKQYFPSRTWLRVDKVFDERSSGDPNLWNLTWETGLKRILHGTPPVNISYGNVYFGDIHAHSFCGFESPCGPWDRQIRDDCVGCQLEGRGNGCGWGKVSSNYEYARDIANLDFFCLSEHDFQMPGDQWKKRVTISNAYNEPGRFVTINGYEYTSWQYGHRNVYFRGDSPPMFPASPNLGRYANKPQVPPEELWDYLQRNAEAFITVPHHMTAAPHPFCWERFNPRYDVNVEIFSGWGSSESAEGPLVGDGSDKYSHLTVQEALKKGLRFGFVSGSDSHDGCPGNAQGISIYNWANKFSKVGSGRTAVVCEELTRTSVFDAMKHRRCYATTGAPIAVDFQIDGVPMGGELENKGIRHLECKVKAPATVERIYVVKNGEILTWKACASKVEELDFKDNKSLPVDSYYIKVVLSDMETAWVSPIFVHGE